MSNKRQKAVALTYADKDSLPRVVAQGAGEIAKRIIQLAKQNNIPVSEDDSLAEMLSKLNTGQSITPECYRLVAEILCFLYHTDKEWREQHSFMAETAAESSQETKNLETSNQD